MTVEMPPCLSVRRAYRISDENPLIMCPALLQGRVLPLRTWQRLDKSPSQVGIRELGLIPDTLPRCRKQSGGKRFIPSIGKPRNVAEDPSNLLFRDIAGKRECIHAACTHRRIRGNR